MEITLRLERPGDYRAVEELTRDAFWSVGQPGCDEHLLVHKLRACPAFVPELTYVAEIEGQIVGHILYSRAKIVGDEGRAWEVLTFGPLSVLPAYQRKGVGGALVRHTLKEAAQLGHRAVVIYGHPDYYPRFGFANAKQYGLTTPDGKNFDAFMALALYDGALFGIGGRFYEDETFHVSREEAALFDKGFAPKEPGEGIPIGVLLQRLSAPARSAVEAHSLKWVKDLERFSGREIAAWHGVGKRAQEVIDAVLAEHALPPKRWEKWR